MTDTWRDRLRLAALCLVGIGAVVSLISLPFRVDELSTACSGSNCVPGQLTAAAITSLEASGIALEWYVAWVIFLDVVAVTAYLVIASVVLLRMGRARMPLIVGVLFSGLALETFPLPALAARYPALEPIATANQRLSIGLGIVVLAAMFPDGRFVPRWSWIVVAVAAAQELLRIFVPGNPTNAANWGDGLEALELLAWIVLLVGFQMHRYRYVSGAVERRQTKWVLLGIGTVIVMNVVIAVVPLLAPDTVTEGSPATILLNSLLDLSLVFALSAIGVAILRFHLFEIDRIVRRTATYALVVGLLGVVYFTVITVLTQVLPSESNLVVAGTTLAIFAAFTPLRRRVQTSVERRFNRNRYLLEREVESFGQRLQHTTETESVGIAFVAEATRALEPRTVGLWVRQP